MRLIKRTFFLMGCLGLLANPVQAQWQSVPSPADRLFSFVEGDNNVAFAGSENTSLWISTNGGTSFQTYATGLPEMNFDIRSFVSSQDTLWAGMYGGGVARSLDGGSTWTSFNNGFETQSMVVAVQKFDNTIYAAVDFAVGLQPSGIYKTSAQQDEWTRSGVGFPGNLAVTSFTITETGVLFAGATIAGPRGNIQVSTDNGHTWLNRNIDGVQSVATLESDGTTVFAGTTDGIYVTNNDGVDWNRLGSQFQDHFIDDILLYNGMLFAAVDQVGVATVAVDDTSWSVLTDNLPIADDYVSTLFIYEDRLFASLSAAHGVWRRFIPVTSVAEDDFIPRRITLSQNYPNPFNPSTTISFGLQARQVVSLEIYDVLGREVAAPLRNEILGVGEHKIVFDAEHLPSGVYFYRLITQEFKEAKRMLLIR